MGNNPDRKLSPHMKDDMRELYHLLWREFPDDKFEVYRTGGKGQTLSISSIYSGVEDICRVLWNNRESLRSKGIFNRIWRVNEIYFYDLRGNLESQFSN